MTEGADKLWRAIYNAVYRVNWDDDKSKSAHVAQAICSELGITPEMVKDVRPLLTPSEQRPHAKNLLAASDALATLLEVAGVQSEAP